MNKSILFCTFSHQYRGYAKSLINSFLQYHPDWGIHALVVNCTEENLKEFTNLHNFTYETRIYSGEIDSVPGGPFASFMSQGRFSYLSDFLEENKDVERVLSLDADCIICKNLQRLFDLLNKYPIIADVHPHNRSANRLIASCFLFNNNRITRKYFKRYKHYYNKRAPQDRLWYTEQRILWKNWGTMHNKWKTKGGKLPYWVVNKEDPYIYFAPGDRRRGAKYKELLNKYKNL